MTDQQVWDNVTWFLERVIPVAEDAGVKLALHPDDPPVSPIGGVARVFRNHAALKRVVDIVPSDANGLTFCVGTFGAMPGDVFDAIRYFGTRNKIHHVHFRNVTGRCVPDVHRRRARWCHGRGHSEAGHRAPRLRGRSADGRSRDGLDHARHAAIASYDRDEVLRVFLDREPLITSARRTLRARRMHFMFRHRRPEAYGDHQHASNCL